MIKKPIRLIELFAGIGSQAMALRDMGANFTNYRVVEFDKYAIQSYNAIHGTNFPTEDITKIHASDLGIVDTKDYDYIVTYSFPCQDLSLAGGRAGMEKDSGTRSGLLWEVERLLKECSELPQTLVMENVTQVHGKSNEKDFNDWLAFLESLGYKNYYKDMNAKDYGMPQNRNRCFMISKLDDEPFEFPQPQELTHSMRDYLEPSVEDKYYLNNTRSVELIHEIETGNKITETRKVGDVELSAVNALNIANAVKHATFDREISVAKTLCARDWKGLKNWGDNIIVEKRYSSANEGGGISEPKILETEKQFANYKVRRLTPRECWRLMGFSDDDFNKAKEVCSNTQLYKQAGNSIVKNVLIALFTSLINGK